MTITGNSKSLITGAAGFIGSHLVDALIADGQHVVAMDLPNADFSRIRDSEADIITGDIRDPELLKRIFEDIDVVYHLAAISRHDVNFPDSEYYRTNVDGTRNVLDAAIACGVRRVVFTATIEAVGMSVDGRPLTEDSPQHPENIYGKTKLQAEELVRRYHFEKGYDTVVVRPPMTYGPKEMILLTRLFGIINKGFYPLIGSGKTLTEFCYVKNQVNGIRLAAENGLPGEVYFISDAESYSLENIIDTIARVMGKRVFSPHIPVPLAMAMGYGFELISKVLRFYPFVIPQTGRPPFSRRTVKWTSQNRLFVDISKARRELGYNPVYSLEDGVAETVAWYRKAGFLR